MSIKARLPWQNTGACAGVFAGILSACLLSSTPLPAAGAPDDSPAPASGSAAASASPASPVPSGSAQDAAAAATTSSTMSGQVIKTEALTEADRLKNAADDALSVGNYEGARSLYVDALKALRKGDSARQRAIRDNLAQAYCFLGKLKEARSEFARALSIANKTCGEESPEAARELDGMSWLAEGEGKIDRAREYCNRALAIRQAKLPPGSPDLADSLEHAGWLAENRNVYSEAERLYQQSLPIRQATSGNNSMAVADILERLGVVTHLSGNAEKARALFDQSRAIKENTAALFQPYAPLASDKRVVYRFAQGAPNCQNNSAGGNWTQRVSACGVTVEASFMSRPSEFVKSSRARVGVFNNSAQNISLLSQPPFLMVIAPKVQPAKYLNAAQLAQTIEQKGERKATKVWRAGKDATTPIFSTVHETAPYWRNNWTPFGYAPSGGNYSNTRTVTTYVPDFEARAQAAQKASDISNKSQTEAAFLRREALGPCLVAPGTSIGGTCDFDCSSFDRALLRIPVGNAVFEFLFDRNKF